MVEVCSNSVNDGDESSQGMGNLALSGDEGHEELGGERVDDAECSRTEGVGDKGLEMRKPVQVVEREYLKHASDAVVKQNVVFILKQILDG
ncbi:hypothetical protein A2U01_0018944, partial [Trifolium medium]|nr:hypothetical protein [Trifolium medium]